jgi:Uma2 family endonuclease
MGVPELWIVDLAARVIEVHREPSGERYQRVETLRAGATVELVAFPDVRLDVSSFLP